MDTSDQKRTSPRAEREVSALLETVTPDNKAALQAALVEVLRYYVEMKAAHNDFAKVFLAGMEEADPRVLLSALQIHRDRMATALSLHDEHLAKFLEHREGRHIAHVTNRMTGGEFRILTDSGNMFHDVSVHRAMRDALRKIGREVVARFSADRPIADVKNRLKDMFKEATKTKTQGGTAPTP